MSSSTNVSEESCTKLGPLNTDCSFQIGPLDEGRVNHIKDSSDSTKPHTVVALTSRAHVVVTSEVYSSGCYRFEVQLDNVRSADVRRSRWFQIGVVDENFDDFIDSVIPYGYFANGDTMDGNQVSANLCETFGTGDKISCEVNFESRTIKFYKDEMNLGVACRKFPSSIRFAVRLTQTGDKVSLLGVRSKTLSCSEWGSSPKSSEPVCHMDEENLLFAPVYPSNNHIWDFVNTKLWRKLRSLGHKEYLLTLSPKMVSTFFPGYSEDCIWDGLLKLNLIDAEMCRKQASFGDWITWGEMYRKKQERMELIRKDLQASFDADEIGDMIWSFAQSRLEGYWHTKSEILFLEIGCGKYVGKFNVLNSFNRIRYECLIIAHDHNGVFVFDQYHLNREDIRVDIYRAYRDLYETSSESESEVPELLDNQVRGLNELKMRYHGAFNDDGSEINCRLASKYSDNLFVTLYKDPPQRDHLYDRISSKRGIWDDAFDWSEQGSLVIKPLITC